MKPRVMRVVPPPTSAIADWYRGADLLDSYAVALPPEMSRDPAVLARALFETPPLWTRGLLRLRDQLMAPLGVKTTTEIRKAGAGDGLDRIGFFPVLRRSPDEIVLGEDDSHLDFRASVLVEPVDGAGSPRLVVTTVVRCRNLLGRTYLSVIQPFHVLIVRSSLSRLRRAQA
jgi:hypothetical protein